MCKVMNARQVGKCPTADRVYVGRPSKWGNPFVIGRDGSRDDVIAKYRAWIVRQPELLAALHELRGKDLVCWCAPELGGCGTMTSTGSGALRSGMTQSCGCLHRERTATSNASRASQSAVPVHRNTKPRTATADQATWKNSSLSYGSWHNMIRRCTHINDPRYTDWGGRGITVCERWLSSFDNFLADMGERPAGMTLDRYPDSNGNYEPGNCRWATPHEQLVNSRLFKLTPEVITEIKRLRTAGLSMQAIGKQLGLHRHTVSRALSGKGRSRHATP